MVDGRMVKGRSVVHLLPIGVTHSDLMPDMEALARFVSRYYGLSTAVLPAVSLKQLKPKSRINSTSGNRQVLAPALLDAMKARLTVASP